MNKQINISVAFSLDLTKILNELVKNNTYMAQLGNITIKYIGTKRIQKTGKEKYLK